MRDVLKLSKLTVIFIFLKSKENYLFHDSLCIFCDFMNCRFLRFYERNVVWHVKQLEVISAYTIAKILKPFWCKQVAYKYENFLKQKCTLNSASQYSKKIPRNSRDEILLNFHHMSNFFKHPNGFINEDDLMIVYGMKL